MIEITNDWIIEENSFELDRLNHSETVFTISNGYFGTRGVFEEGHPGEVRSTFIHGIFDDVPVVFTELANTPDWLEMEILLAGERFCLNQGTVLNYHRELDLHTGILRRTVKWRSPQGRISSLVFERFASLSNEHLAGLRVLVRFENHFGKIVIRSGLNGEVDNKGVKHWDWLGQSIKGQYTWLHCCTRATKIDLASAFWLEMHSEQRVQYECWNVHNHPTLAVESILDRNQSVVITKWVLYANSQEMKNPLDWVMNGLKQLPDLVWGEQVIEHANAWKAEWEHCDVVIDGDVEAQLAVRFNIFQLLSAAPRNNDRVNIGAKTLSGYGYRGHCFWDTEIFMLPFFTYTRPAIAKNLLTYRFNGLQGARRKASANGYRGAQFPWESALTGDEVTPTWIPDNSDRTKLIRIWTGDIEIHISADVAFSVWQYWQVTGDDEFIEKYGAEMILETARFWASRVEWVAERERFEISDIIGPDEYHDHVDNNVYTNYMARWNLQAALQVIEWLKEYLNPAWQRLRNQLDLKEEEIQTWKRVIEGIYISHNPQTHLMEQFDGYFQRKDINLPALEPRTQSIQALLGIESTNETQVLKQPDVLMLFYVLPQSFDVRTVQVNYDYYSVRTDHTYGSSLGPSIHAIMSAWVGDRKTAYEHFMRAARADLIDERGNASDGIHGASAGGLWQAVVFGFGGLKHTEDGWITHPHLPEHWKRVIFTISDHGKPVQIEVRGQE